MPSGTLCVPHRRAVQTGIPLPRVNAIKLRFFCRVGRAKPTIVINLRPDLRFNDLVGAAKLYPPYKKNVFLLNLMAFLLRVGTRIK